MVTMSSRRPKVLIVDDEDNIVLALFRVLYQDNNRYDVLLSRTAEIAQQILLDVPIDVLVTDVHLPEKSGMDLLTWAAVESPNTRVIVMTAFDITGIKDKAHAFGCLRLMRKPFDVHEMRSTILSALDRRDSFAGNLTDLSVTDVIQMLCLSRKTTALRLSEGSSSGVILIENGELVHAIWDNLVGEDAFFKMLSVKNGLFYTSPLPPDVERTLRGDWQFLLIEGLRKLDEEKAHDDEPRSVRFLSSAPGSTGPKEAPPRPAAAPTPMPRPQPPARASFSAPQPARPVPSAMLGGHREEPANTASAHLGKSAAVSTAIAARNTQAEVAQLIDQGFAALRSGNRDEARRIWEEALELDPSNRQLQLNLRKLEVKNGR